MSIDDAHFKEAMSRFASGVTVVTTEHDGTQYGMTVASFASLAIHPPLVIICVAKAAKSHDAIRASGQFGVSILASTQEALSGKFASKSEDKFAGVEIRRGASGLPLIEGAICTLECRVHDQFPGGDHSIFVGEVIDAQTLSTQAGEGAPLVYYRSAYRAIS
jgi:flavin reductase (DIM6/NTAB) family NADH-FMN oxidoreductase RutF